MRALLPTCRWRCASAPPTATARPVASRRPWKTPRAHARPFSQTKPPLPAPAGPFASGRTSRSAGCSCAAAACRSGTGGTESSTPLCRSRASWGSRWAPPLRATALSQRSSSRITSSQPSIRRVRACAGLEAARKSSCRLRRRLPRDPSCDRPPPPPHPCYAPSLPPSDHQRGRQVSVPQWRTVRRGRADHPHALRCEGRQGWGGEGRPGDAATEKASLWIVSSAHRPTACSAPGVAPTSALPPPPAGAVGHGGHYHSQSPEAFFTHIPGIRASGRVVREGQQRRGACPPAPQMPAFASGCLMLKHARLAHAAAAPTACAHACCRL